MFNFGCGNMFGNPNAQNLATNPTPQWFGTVQDISVDIDATIKELRGQFQFPDDTAVADKKLSIKCKFGKIEAQLFNQLFFADSYNTGITVAYRDTSHTVPASTPWQITPTPPNSGVIGIDLGVYYANTGLPFQKVASGPTVGQYTFATGVYTFATADASVAVVISYTYTLTTGNTLTVNNQLMGYAPQFDLWLNDPYSSYGNGMHFYAVKSGKLSAPRKRDDYTIIDLEMEAFANTAGKVFDWFQLAG